MQKPQRIRSGFNFFAPFYDFFAFVFFGNSILNAQAFLLPEVGKCKSALVLGGGTGKLLMELLKRDVAEHYCYVDISDKMIAKSRARLKKYFPEKINSVQFICGTVNDVAASEKYELIITPFVLDCIEEEKLGAMMEQLKTHHVAGGKWLFADFNVPEKRRSLAAVKVRVLYFCFNVVCGLGMKRLPDFEKEFWELKYKKVKENYFLQGLMVARIYSWGE